MRNKLKKVSILGSTGSIGVNALNIIDDNPKDFKIIGLAAGKNLKLLLKQALKYRPKYLSVREHSDAKKLQKSMFSRIGTSYKPDILFGEDGVVDVATRGGSDLVLSAIVGSSGLKPTYEAVKRGKSIALANKESIVMAGRIRHEVARQKRSYILPVDSEHSAIFQSMVGHNRAEIKRLILTASGGPFFRKTKDYLKKVKLKEALKHPNWTMGAKITIDSATLMNKALEIIEARWLFNIPAEKISVMIHPQSIIHSIVEYQDGSMISQMGVPDMRVPISYALTYPERLSAKKNFLNLDKVDKLTFFKPNDKMFPTLGYAYKALESGDSMCIALNAANEASVEAFICGKIQFIDIPRLIGRILKQHREFKIGSIEDALGFHKECVLKTKKFMEIN